MTPRVPPGADESRKNGFDPPAGPLYNISSILRGCFRVGSCPRQPSSIVLVQGTRVPERREHPETIPRRYPSP